MSTELRNILRQLNQLRQAVNVGAENRKLKERNERLAILNALRDLKRRDDIVLSTDFNPLELIRREKRMDGALRTVVAELVEGLNRSDESKIESNLQRMREIILKENPSLGMIGMLKGFLGKFMGRLNETAIDEIDRKNLAKLIKSVDGLASNKVTNNDQFKLLLKSVGKSSVDDFSPSDLEEFRELYNLEEDTPIRKIKEIIKANLSGKQIEDFLNAEVTSGAEIRKMFDDLNRTLESLSEDEIRDEYFSPAQKRKYTKRDVEKGFEEPDWDTVLANKKNMINFLVGDFSAHNDIDD